MALFQQVDDQKRLHSARVPSTHWGALSPPFSNEETFFTFILFIV